jgi:hypothetical protein
MGHKISAEVRPQKQHKFTKESDGSSLCFKVV